jgi:thioester reductase-like protein
MIFVTGFPGFLASELIARLLEKDQNLKFACLVQPKFKALAESAIDKLSKRFSGNRSQIQIIDGDITEENLGLVKSTFDPSLVTRIFHFAAVYDLSVEEKLANLVNVEGTRNVLKFARSCPSLTRFDYVSTCYVSGRFKGVFHESDLEHGQSFNNFYESTKYEAERLVRADMEKGLPTTIYRPAIVVGNSETGETQKFDGPYFVMQWLLRQPRIAFLPRLTHPEKYFLNVVPSNYVLDAMNYLASKDSSIGKTFQLADPHPLSIQEMVHTLAIATERKVIGIPLPKKLAKFALKVLPSAERWLGIPSSALDYFDHPTRYDVSATLRALEGSGISCPRFRAYAFPLVSFMKHHPKLRTRALT